MSQRVIPGTAQPFDVVIVGSGAAGGMAAYALAKAGVKVCMLEAGRHYDPLTETPMTQTAAEAPLRGAPTPDKPFGYYDATVGGGWDIPGEPYTVAQGSHFKWWRSRMLGGRTNHWGRISLRYAPHDFKPHSHDGLGVDWPVSYEEIAPYYDRTTALIGVFGTNEGLDDMPDAAPGVLQEPPAPRAHELLVQKAGDELGRRVVPVHAAILTRPINGRAACIYSTPCLRGCSIKANFQSTTVLIPPALATGNLTVVPLAMAYEVAVNAQGRATGVHYVDKQSGQHRFIAASHVMLAASAMESARILLNSKSSRFPNGLANGSGLVGKYISDTVGSMVTAQIPALESLPPHDDFGVFSDHVYVPWWGLKEQRAGKLGFPRGYHFEIGGGRAEPRPWSLDLLEKTVSASHGTAFKDEMRRYFGSFVTFTQRGEMIPTEQCSVSIDAQVKDQYGIPVPHFAFAFSDHERNQARHARKAALEFVDALGGRVVPEDPPPPKMGEAEATVDARAGGSAKPPEAPRHPAEQELHMNGGGEIIHEIGGVRMGASARDSVLDAGNFAWDVPNLQVIDGGAFPTHPHKNPTLTILALAWRASDLLVQRMRNGK